MDYPPFERKEYEARLKMVQEGMLARGIDVLLITSPENLYYLTGFQTTGYYMYQAAVVPGEGDPTPVVRNLEGTLLSTLTWMGRGEVYMDYEDPAEVTARAIRDLGGSKGVIGIEKDNYFTPISLAERITAVLPKARIANGSGLVEAARMIKSEREIVYIRRAAQAATAGLAAGIEATAPGRTENDIAAAVYARLLPAGSEYPGSPPYVASGPRSGLAHATWAGRVVEPVDIVFLEVGGNINRYGGSHMRTVSVGKPPAEVARRAAVVAEALTTAIAAIKPGVTSGEVDAACRSTFEREGYGALFRHRTGYSIGVGFPPGWGEGHVIDIKPNDPRELQPNMTFHLVPLILEVGNWGIGMSETVRVTETGCEVLTDYPRELVII